MASPANGRSREDLFARPAGGAGPVQELDSDSLTPAQLPDYSGASDADLVSLLHDHNALAFVELYRRTLPAAHGVTRRLLSHTSDIEGVLRRVYTAIWQSPPPVATPVTQEVRVRCFALAEAALRHRDAAPAAPSAVTILEGLPPAVVRRLSAVERDLATLPERTRRAVVLAHDAGVASSDQDDPEAGDLLEAGLLALSEPGESPTVAEPSDVAHMADWVLGLLPPADAADVAEAVRGDHRLAQLEKSLRRARRRLEGLPATPNMTQRVLAGVLSAATVPAPAVAAPPRRSGVGLIAASIVLVLVAGVVSFSSWPPERPQAAVAQASTQRPVSAAPPAAAARAPRESRPPRSRPARPRIVPPAANAARAAQPAAPPVSVTIPKMQVRKRLVGLSVLNDGTLAAPEDFDAPGWYREGVAPGDAGPAVIVGHVDSTDGPAVFFKLSTLKAGDKAHVKRADGTTVTFVVDRVERYAKDKFPTQQVYGPTPGAELRLITCGGAFDNTTLSYDDNVVAYAHIEQPRPRGRAPRANGRRNAERADAAGTYDHLGRPRARDDRAARRAGGRRATEPAAG